MNHCEKCIERVGVYGESKNAEIAAKDAEIQRLNIIVQKLKDSLQGIFSNSFYCNSCSASMFASDTLETLEKALEGK